MNRAVVQQLNAAVLFAAGFLMRPPGGWMFGQLADNYGRRNALTPSVGLNVLRVADGRSDTDVSTDRTNRPDRAGDCAHHRGRKPRGRVRDCAAFLTEVADERNCGFYSSFQYVTLIGAQLYALLVVPLQKDWLTPGQIACGWRIPFVIGAASAVIAAVMRRRLHETETYEAAKEAGKRDSSLRALLRDPREVMLVVGLTAGGRGLRPKPRPPTCRNSSSYLSV
jgi:MFS transporter, MHS family, alpha-ketoglutarate permease